MDEKKDCDRINIWVVDDEPISADEMSDLIAEEFRECGDVKVSTAYHAGMALKLADEMSCDVLISDIQMPGKSGLELAQELRQRFPDIFVLFLTGFDHFSYAYEAFRQSAVHYLLKTEGDDAVLQAVHATINKLRERRGVKRRIQEAEEKYTQMIPAYRERLFSSMLHDEVGDVESSEIQELFPGKCYLVLAREDSTESKSMRSKLVVQSAVRGIVTDALEKHLLWSETTQIDSELVWGFATTEEIDYANAFFQLIRKARKMLEEQCGARLFFIVADTPTGAMELSERYAEMRNMLMRDIVRGEAGTAIRRALKVENVVDEDTKKRYALLRRQMELCEADVRNCAFDQLQKHVEPILNNIQAQGGMIDAYSYELFARLTATLMTYVNQNGLHHLLEKAGVGLWHNAADNAEALAQLILLLKKDSENHMDVTVKSIAHYVVDYIHEHISEDISISVLAETSGYSSGYLSRVFRQEEGISIHEFITMARMSLARELLHNTNMRVYEIAASCGYDNATYFIKVFKTNTGCTPQEYKQSIADR